MYRSTKVVIVGALDGQVDWILHIDLCVVVCPREDTKFRWSIFENSSNLQAMKTSNFCKQNEWNDILFTVSIKTKHTEIKYEHMKGLCIMEGRLIQWLRRSTGNSKVAGAILFGTYISEVSELVHLPLHQLG